MNKENSRINGHDSPLRMRCADKVARWLVTDTDYLATRFVIFDTPDHEIRDVRARYLETQGG